MTIAERIAGNKKALRHAEATLAEILNTNKRVPGFYPESDELQARKVVGIYRKRLAQLEAKQ